jgi:uncharacterized repeat protein (TIGR01451 family)
LTVSQTKQSPFRAFPVLIALFFNVVIGPALPIVASAAADGIDDYAQCQIGNPKPVGLDCAEKWTNGILNATHNDYAEGEVVPQRLLMDFGSGSGGTSHSVTISYMARKDSGGQHHAYDYLATWNYTYVNADRCQTPTATDCIAGPPTTFPMPSDGNSVPPGGPQPTSTHELPPANRQFVMYGGTLTGTSAITHSVDPAEAGSDYGNVTVTFTVGAGGKVQLLFGGHLAVGTGPLGWGANLGSSSISGGPYHIRITAIDDESIGNRDNQIMSGAIEPLFPLLVVEKVADAATVSAGSNIGFTITVTNNGPGVANNATLNDPLPAGSGVDWAISPAYAGPGTCSITGSPPTETLTCAFGNLADDASASVHVQSATTAASCGEYPNTATADADNFDPVQASASTTVQCPNLSISKTPDGGTVNAGDPISFTITVSNAGPGAATNVDIDDNLPAGFEWVESPDKAECTIVSNVLHCDIASLASGASFSVTVTSPTQAADCGLVTNTATGDADNHAQITNSGNQTVQCPGLNVIKEADPGNIVAGDTAVFDIVVWNTGPGTALNVTLHDELPGGIVWTEDSPDCAILAGVLDCDFGDLGVTTQLNSPARVTVSGTTDRQDCGELDNTAIADADNDEPIEASASITVRCPTLVIDKAANVELITKTLDAQGNVIDVDPDVVTWTLTYTLTNGPVTNAVITDPIPVGLTYVSGSASNGGVYNAATRTLTWTFPTLSAGGSVTFQTTVNQDALAGVILNVATIDSDETESDKGEDSIRIVEDQELGGTSTPQPSLPSTAMSLPSNAGGLAAILFGAILIAALGGLAYVNVTAVRRRR